MSKIEDVQSKVSQGVAKVENIKSRPEEDAKMRSARKAEESFYDSVWRRILDPRLP